MESKQREKRKKGAAGEREGQRIRRRRAEERERGEEEARGLEVESSSKDLKKTATQTCFR